MGYSVRGEVDIAAAGTRDLAGAPVTVDTIFDLASVSKVAGTTSALHRLAHLGELLFEDSVHRYLDTSPCAPTTTVRDLLTHRAGLWEWQPLYFAPDPMHALDVLPLRYAPGRARRYSDLGFMLLGRVVEAVTGASLGEATRELVHSPLAMAHTAYGPVSEPAAASSLGDRFERCMVATGEPYPILLEEPDDFAWREAEIVGQANDGNCFHAFRGVSGHAGLFSTAADLLALGASLASSHLPDDGLWGAGTSAEVFSDGPDAGQALGWGSLDVVVKGEPRRMLWHPGFTGCALGFVPGEDLAVVLLSNRLLAQTPIPVTDLWAKALAGVPDLAVLSEPEY